MAEIQIFQTFHKDYLHNLQSPFLRPVGVNGYRHEGFASDAEGDHIAALNPSYCELTVQYWAWKNTQSEWVGFCHYRRYLNFMLDQTWAAPGNSSLTADQAMVDYLAAPAQAERLKQLLQVWEVVLPRPMRLLPSVEQQYLSCVQPEVWQEFLRAVHLMYGRQSGVKDYFSLATEAPMWNMFVMPRDLFNAYCEDLFTLVDALYARIGTPWDSYQNRYPGFLAERFLGFWLHLRRARSCQVPMLFCG
jgi:hypothetical protein